MAGRGERFASGGFETPKPLIEIREKPMISWCLSSLGLESEETEFIFITRKYTRELYNTQLSDLLARLVENQKQIQIDYITEGPACTSLLAKQHINNETPLVICNCDQIMKWSGQYFLHSALSSPYDGVVVTYDENTPKNSYAKLSANGDVTQIAEKQVISNVSLNGIHFWKQGRLFVESAEAMIASNERYNNEFYVGPTYNHLIKSGKRVGIFHIPKQCHIPVGVPKDLDIFLSDSVCA
jgi:dTDP-glucose pyrophosphorylase